MYVDGYTYLRPPLPTGHIVRISKHKSMFENRFISNSSKKNFRVSAAPATRRGIKRTIIEIKDINNDIVEGSLYLKELQQISCNQYRFERVLKRKTAVDGTLKLYIKWENWLEIIHS